MAIWNFGGDLSQGPDLYADSVSVFFGAPTIEGYEYRGELGRGGMGLVLHAFDVRLGRDVAIKLICNSQEQDLVKARFQREATTLARLEHNHIARVFDYGEESGMPFLVMEYVPGKTLRKLVLESLRVNHRVPDFDWTLRIFQKVAVALQYCHFQGVLHRDIKPENIMVEVERERPVLIDFGLIAKVPGEGFLPGFSQSLSRSGVICGTWQYMSPEQMSGKDREDPLTEATDVWSFASALYFCLTGKEPYNGKNDIAFFAARGAGAPIPVRKVNPEVPRWIGRLCDRCFEVDPKKRPGFSELTEILEDDADEQGLLSTGFLMALFVLAAIAIGAGVYWLTVFPVDEGPIPRPVPATKTVTKAPVPKGSSTSGAGNLSGDKADGKSIKGDGPRIEDGRKELGKGLKALNDRLDWNVLKPEVQDAVIAEIGERLGPQYEFYETRTFRCDLDTGIKLAHRIGCFRHKKTGILLHLLPGGRYAMGGNVTGAKPIHEVRIRPFLMGRAEVTWKEMAGAKLLRDDSDMPVCRVAPAKIIEWLGAEEIDLRLPSESEWEYACRGGSKTRFFWGDQFNDRYCWGKSNSDQVGHKALEHKEAYNAFGMIDIVGNYFELCADAWNPNYRNGPQDENPRYLGNRAKVVTRGGCFYNTERNMLSAFRYSMERKAQAFVGLRVAKSLP